MMRAFLRILWIVPGMLCCIAIFGGGSVHAEVVVRSGEHPGHSRIVFDFDRLPEWSLLPRPGGYRLEFKPAPPGFDIDRVFRFIPHTRLAGLRVDEAAGAIDLDLACRCVVETMVTRSRALVVDIRDRSDQDTNEDPVAAMTKGPVVLLAGTLPETDPRPNLTVSSNPPPATGDVESIPALPLDLTTTTDLPPPLDRYLTQTLAEELARAAAQGMVDADRDLWRAEELIGREAQSDPDESAPEPSAAPRESSSEIVPNIRIRNGFDVPFDPADKSDLPAFASGPSCPDARQFAVTAWADDRPFNLQVGELRSRLVGEFDEPDTKVALDLARLYTHFGFGAEARTVIDNFLPDDTRVTALRTLSRLIETGESDGSLVSFGECGGMLPLWAILQEEQGQPPSVVRTESVLMNFSTLPPYLRRILGYRLAARFAARSDFASAEMVRFALERISSPDDPSLVLSSSQTAPIQDRPEDVEAALQDLALSLRPEATSALLLNLEGRLARNERIPVDLIDTASALSFKFAASEEGRQLKEAEIKARLANGDFDAGFRELTVSFSEGLLTEPDVTEIWNWGLRRLLDESDEAAFARQMFEKRTAESLTLLTEKLRIELSDRLLLLGFPDQAERVAPPRRSLQDGLFAARLARAAGDMEEVWRLAQSESDPEAKAFLAETLSAAGRHADAFSIYAELDDGANGVLEAWRAGIWSEVAGLGPEDLASAAEAMVDVLEMQRTNEPTRAETETQPTLAGSNLLLEESAALRGLLTSVLEGFPRVEN